MSEDLLKLPNEIDNPPGCFQYRVPETGVNIPAAGTLTLRQCCERVSEHYRANNMTPPQGLQARIADYCCRHAPVGTCHGDDRPLPLPNSIQGSGVDQVLTGTKAIASWLLQGKEGEDVAKARAEVCLLCSYNKDVSAGCRSCKKGVLAKLKEIVTQTLQGEASPWEQGLGACEVCGCSLRLKIRTKHDVIKKNMPDAQMRALPPRCWIIKEDELNG